MQQLPREGDVDEVDPEMKKRVKTILAVDSGKELWELDYSQMEFRLAGCYSKEPAIIEAYAQGSDMHQATADTVGVPRYHAKTLNFALLYGAQYEKIAKMLSIPPTESRAMVTSFWKGYPLLEEVVQKTADTVQAQGYLSYWTGRRRHIRWRSEYHKAFNSLIQGGGMEICKESCLRLQREGLGELVVAQVHDSLWVEVDAGDITTLERIKAIMEWPKESFVIDFPVDMKRLAA
jgi:DNA polymerase-1